MPDFPPTIIVVHPKERRSKCTIEPLRDRPDFVFWKYPHWGTESLDDYVQLGLNGPILSAGEADKGLLVLDGTWRLASRMASDFSHIPTRSLPPCQTAYPRASKLFEDPNAGLATVEAVFVAYWQLGRETAGLLDHYRWADSFLKRNAILFDNSAPKTVQTNQTR